MRIELELIEKIERYLNGHLSPVEAKDFEDQMNANPELLEEVKIQREVMEGIGRADLRQKVQKAGHRYKRIRNFKRWGIGGFILILAIVALMINQSAAHKQAIYEGTNLPEFNEAGEKNWSTADANLPAQTYYLDADKDTVIETKGGMVLSVPANGFLGKNGQAVKGKFELIIKEALDPASIIRAGLSTRSGNRLLETGGMFFLDARKNGEILSVDPKNATYAELPTDSVKSDMQLFRGKRMPDSSIDWVNPGPLEHMLVPVDIQNLNFYPPHYIDSLKSWGYQTNKKSYTDSIYYSLSSIFDIRPPVQREEDRILDTSFNLPGDSIQFTHPCGINPSKVRAIWDEKFQNTLISTREFEERMTFIHQSGSSEILDAYVNNLDKPLYYIDSVLAEFLNGNRPLRDQFLLFASRHDGKVKNGNRQFDKLKEYYKRKSAAFTEAIAKTQRDFWSRQAELDGAAYGKTLEHQTNTAERMNKLFEEEFSLNLKEAWKQLGYDTTVDIRSRNRKVYAVQITNSGWCNVDRYVEESVLARTSLNYTDPQTGKKAMINYLPVSFQVEESVKFDRVTVYLLPDKLSSFLNVPVTNGIYKEKLNELIKYRLLCVGYKNDQTYFYSQGDIVSGDYAGIVLTSISNRDLDVKLNKLSGGSTISDLKKENRFIQFEITDQKRQKRNQSILELRQRLINLIFPCNSPELK